MLPATSHTVARFLVFISRTCWYSTCNNYLSAIVSLHKLFSFDCHFRDSYLIKLIGMGLKNSLGTTVKQKQPLSPAQPIIMYRHIDFGSINQITMWAALMICFRSLIRKGNMLPSSTQNLAELLIRRSHVEVDVNGITLNVYTTTTLRHKDRVLKIPINFVSQRCFCAATMYVAHLCRCPLPTNGTLFYKEIGENWQPL